MSFDIAVAYRIYPRVSKTPFVFPHDKLKLAELALYSFRRSLGSVRAKVFAMLDGCPSEYDLLFQRYFPGNELVIMRFDRIGNAGTFGRQIDLLLEQDDAEAIYFAEDDYLYVPDRFSELLGFMNSGPNVDFVTAYDHPDYDALEIHQNASECRSFGAYRFRTVASTCLTFLTRKETLRKSAAVLRTYCRKNLDVSVWMSLTKQQILRPAKIGKYLFTGDWFYFALIANSWRHAALQNLFGPKWKLWAPRPTVATHMEREGLAPGVNWQDEAARLMAEIGLSTKT
jgi:hypothetical protein